LASGDPLLQHLLEGFDLQGSGTHPLSVHRIKTAQRITQDQQALRKSPESFIMTQYTGGKTVSRDVCNPFGVFEQVVQLRGIERLGKREETLGVARRIFSKPSG